MRSAAVAVLSLGFIVGCAGSSNRGDSVGPAIAVPAIAITEPDLSRRFDLALLNGDEELRLGDSAKAAATFLPRAPKAFEVRVLPEGFPTGFRAKGWETDTEGYAVVLYGDDVALAMRTLQKADVRTADDLLAEYRRRFRREEPVFVGSRTSRYWFFQAVGHRLVICSASNPQGSQTVTVTLGTDNLMDALRFSMVHASKDGLRADKSIDEAKTP